VPDEKLAQKEGWF